MPKSTQFDRRTQRLLTLLAARLPDESNRYPRLPKWYWPQLHLLKQERIKALELVWVLIAGGRPQKFLAITLAGDLCNPVEAGEEAEADRIVAMLTKITKRESNLALLEAAADALGDIYRVSAMPAIYQLSFHPDNDVRLAATQAYSSGLDVDGENLEPRYFQRIIELTEDKNPDVRDWAVFHLGRQSPFTKLQTPEIRDILLKHTHDRHPYTKSEAFLGLAERDDTSQLDRFCEWFAARVKRGWSNDLNNNLHTAGIYASPRLYETLRRAETIAYDGNQELLRWALKRCDPDDVVRIKTPRQIGVHLEEFDWNLSPDGVRVVYSNGAEIVNLQSECELIEMYTNYQELLLVFKKIRNNHDMPTYLSVDDTLVVVIAGAEVPEVPSVEYPAQFEGIHNITPSSCSLKINNQTYKIAGKDIVIQFIPG